MNEGAYGPMHDLSAEEKQIFEKATKGLLGVKYEPQRVATQVVNGINYRFECSATLVMPEAKPYKAEVTIYKPLQGEPIITEIEKI